MRRCLAGWRLALRLGHREARRAKWRSLLIVVMIGLPVAGVTVADVIYQTWQVSSAEGMDRRLGRAEAEVSATDHVVQQGIDPVSAGMAGEKAAPVLSDTEAGRLLRGRRLLPFATGSLAVRTRKGATYADVTRTDLTDPLTRGLWRRVRGRVPDAPGEVAVSTSLAARGPGIGDELVLPGHPGQRRTVVGIIDSTSLRDGLEVYGSDLPFDGGADQPSWLVDGGPMTWSQVRMLNRHGAYVLDRSIVVDPPAAALAADRGIREAQSGPADPSTIVILVLVVVMVVIEVVLLAGPAFAVGARRQSRDLALVGAAGGTPQQLRRVVLGSAVVLGGLAVVVGLGTGIVLARVLQPLAQRLFSEWFGPFEVPWTHLVLVAVVGLASAVLAAAVPAWAGSRRSIVAVLAGRRADGPPSRTSPVLGVLLLGVGVALAVFGAQHELSGIPLAVSAVLCILGLLLLVPALVALVAWLGARMPLWFRFAVRDAHRHRSRTVPAVGAVAATVAGVVALGISTGSDELESRATYTPQTTIGAALVTAQEWGSDERNPGPAWVVIKAKVDKAVPGATVTPVTGTSAGFLEPRLPGGEPLIYTAGGEFGPAIVAGGELPSIVTSQVPTIDRAAAARTLRAGGAVVFTTDRRQLGATTVRLDLDVPPADGTGPDRKQSLTVPALYAETGGLIAPASAVVAPAVAARLGLQTKVAGLFVHGTTISKAVEADLSEGLADGSHPAELYVERGYQRPPEVLIVQIVLAGLAVVLMLGGTLTATALALADARSDLATLSAVGASTRTRRAVAAAYALSIAVMGAVPGALVGFVPGVALAYALTSDAPRIGGLDQPAFYLSVPWSTLLLVVVVLPLLVAALVAVCVRGRLPLVARID